MPYPNVHACRIKSPDDFQPKSFRALTDNQPKGVTRIIARPKGKATTEVQAIRYDKDIWDEEKAQADCEDAGGTFEAASEEAEEATKYPEASWQDIIGLALDEAIDKHEKENTKMPELEEATTIKAQVTSLLKQADALLDMKGLPDAVVAGVKSMRASLKKSWDELSKDEPPVEPAVESKDTEIAGDFMALVEAAKNDMLKVKIIQPGWGSSGYYSQELLQKSAPIYKEGTKMFWDHPSLSEEKERPERSLRDLAGILVSDGKWDSGGSAGPGIYASAKVFGGYKEVLSELAPHIGVSHRALGKAKKGEAEGQKGNIIEQITAAQSVDFVTSPGAGGKVLQLFEAARTGILPIKETEQKEETHMTAEEVKALQEKVASQDAEIARLREVEILREARTFVATELEPRTMPTITRSRLIEALSKDPPVKEGKLDTEAFKTKIKETVDSEIDYLAKVTGSGEIKGMNSTLVTVKEGDLQEAYKHNYMSQGKSLEEAERLAELAVSGR